MRCASQPLNGYFPLFFFFLNIPATCFWLMEQLGQLFWQSTNCVRSFGNDGWIVFTVVSYVLISDLDNYFYDELYIVFFLCLGNRRWSVGYFRKCPDLQYVRLRDTRLCPHCHHEAFHPVHLHCKVSVGKRGWTGGFVIFTHLSLWKISYRGKSRENSKINCIYLSTITTITLWTTLMSSVLCFLSSPHCSLFWR